MLYKLCVGFIGFLGIILLLNINSAGVYSAKPKIFNKDIAAKVAHTYANIATAGGIEAQNVKLLGHIGGVTEAVYVYGNIAYIGEGPRLTLINVSDPISPVLMSKTEPLNGIIHDIFVANNIAYVITTKAGNRWGDTDGTMAGNGWLYLINVLEPLTPKVISYLEIPGWRIENVFIEGNLAYISGSDNIRIIDVSNPIAPVEIGSLPYLGPIIVKSNIAYIAAGNNFLVLNIANLNQTVQMAELTNVQLASISLVGNLIFGIHYNGASNGITVIDVSNPNMPSILASIGTISSIPPLQFYIEGTTLFAMEQSPSVKLHIFDISNLNEITEIGTFDDFSTDVSTGIGRVDIFVNQSKAYISSSDGGLQIVDVTDPYHPSKQGFYDIFGGFRNIFVENNLLYGAEPGKGLRILDVSIPSNIAQTGLYSSSNVVSVWVSDTEAYLVDGYSGLKVLNVGNPATPTEVGSYFDNLYPSDIFVDKNIAYMTAGYSSSRTGLALVDITTAEQPKFLSFYQLYLPSNIITVNRGVAYVNARGAASTGMYGIDTSNVVSPTYLNAYSAGTYSSQAYILEDTAYIVDDHDEMQIVDISLSNNLTKLGSTAIRHPQDISVAADIGYVSHSGGGLTLLDVSDPNNLTQVGFYRSIGNNPTIFIKNGIVYLTDNVGGLFILQYTKNVGTTYSISGRVIDSSGICISNVNINVNSEGDIRTNTDGSYIITGLRPGAYNLTASKNGCAFSTLAPITVPPTAIEVNFNATAQIETGVIKGTVYHLVGGHEEVLVGAQAEIKQEFNQASIQIGTNSEGIYQTPFQPGICKVTIRLDDYYTQIKNNVIVKSGETTALNHYLVSEKCLPTAMSCAAEVAQLAPSVVEVSSLVGAINTGISVVNSICEVGNRWEAGDELGVLISMLSVMSEPFEKTPGVGDLILEPLKTALSCLEGVVYDKLVEVCGGYTSCIIDYFNQLPQLLRKASRFIVLIHIDNLTQREKVDVNQDVQLHIYNRDGSHLGFQNGEYINEIPNSLFMKFGSEYQLAIVANADDEYNIKVNGKVATTYQMIVLHPKGSLINQVSYKDISTQPNSVASLYIAPETEDYALNVDINGDMINDSIVIPQEIKSTNLSIAGPSEFIVTHRNGSIILEWDESNRANLRGYKVHYGHHSRFYNSSIDIGNQTRYEISNLARGMNYYFAVTSYDQGNTESEYSNEQEFYNNFVLHVPLIQR